jgi:hypothetical protein
MSVLDWIVGVPILLGILYYLGVGVILIVTELVPFLWDTFVYERRGVCPRCRLKYLAQQSRITDQTFGEAFITRYVCPNGHVGMEHGNRRFADWADF